MNRKTNRRKVARAVGSFLAGLGFAGAGGGVEPVRAGTTNLNPSKDNTLYEDVTGSLSNGAGSAFFTGMTNSGLRRRGLLAFDLSSVPTNAQVTSTTLALYDDKAASTTAPLAIRRVLQNWGEGTSNSDGISGGGGGAPSATGDATWHHTFYPAGTWTTDGGVFSSTVSATANLMVGTTTVIGSTTQMNSDVQGWINNPANNFGWITIGDETNFLTAMRISSRESSDPSKRPLLSVTYNASTWKTGSGLWSSPSNWDFGVPNGLGAEANFNFPSGFPTTVTLDTAKTLGSLNFNAGAYVLTGTALTISRSTASAPVTINVASGGLQRIESQVNIGRDLVTTVGSNTLDMFFGGVNWSPGVSLNASGNGGTLRIQNVRVNTLTIGSGHTVAIPFNGGASGVSRATTIANSGKLDLVNNKLITTDPAGSWDGSAYTGITAQVASGKGTSNTWNGSTGIVTSMPEAIGSNYTSIGVARASDVRPNTATATELWAGQTITGTDTLVMYTYGGDANLDGKLNVDDYIKIDSGIAANLTGWVNGDFNYDGKINIDDYTTVIDANIGNQNGVFFTAGDATLSVASVPEPAALTLLLFPALLLRRRDRVQSSASRERPGADRTGPVRE